MTVKYVDLDGSEAEIELVDTPYSGMDDIEILTMCQNRVLTELETELVNRLTVNNMVQQDIYKELCQMAELISAPKQVAH